MANDWSTIINGPKWFTFVIIAVDAQQQQQQEDADQQQQQQDEADEQQQDGAALQRKQARGAGANYLISNAVFIATHFLYFVLLSAQPWPNT